MTQASIFDQYTFMDVKVAQDKWGHEKLDKNKFKDSGLQWRFSKSQDGCLYY